MIRKIAKDDWQSTNTTIPCKAVFTSSSTIVEESRSVSMAIECTENGHWEQMSDNHTNPTDDNGSKTK